MPGNPSLSLGGGEGHKVRQVPEICNQDLSCVTHREHNAAAPLRLHCVRGAESE